MLTMTSILDRALRLYGDRTAIIDEDKEYSWSEFYDRISRAAAVLADLGVGQGDHFGIVSHNSFRQAEILYAGYFLGAVPVPINYRLAVPEVKFILEDSGSKLLIVENVLADLLNDETLSQWQGNAVYLSAETADVPWLQYETLLEKAKPHTPADVSENDDALLLYTGGTTGRSKGVRLTHRNLAGNAVQISTYMQPNSGDRYLHVAPMFHAADLVANAFTLMGAAHHYIAKPSGRSILEVIQKHRITATMIPPTLIIMILEEEGFADFDISTLKKFVFGSAPMTPKWIKRALEDFSTTEIWHGYGLTETSPMVTLSPLERDVETDESDYVERWKSAGQPVVGTDVRILDEDGNELSVGEVAEVVVRGPQIAKGYLNLPKETDEVFQDGWFRTGDVGRVDEEGYLYLLDRKKDMVITGGENVYTGEVEAALCVHQDILEAAVFGVPHELYGEALVAAIVLRADKAFSEEEIIQHCRGYIGGYKIPRRVFFIDELPKNAVGKVLKRDLRDQYVTTA